MGPLDAYVVCPPGVERLTAQEVGGLGVAVARDEVGGLEVALDSDELVRLALGLRTASRILVRLVRFGARDFATLERKVRGMPWDLFSRPGDAVRIQVSSKKSRLYHQRAIAERVGRAALAAGRDVVVAAEGNDAQAQRLVVRMFRDRCTVSVDATGDHLHRRGYREAVAKAPLRENLAAAALMAAGWNGRSPLVDPMCGSGTLVIEGALLARRLAPGRNRSFGFLRWPAFERAVWTRGLEAADRVSLDRSPVSLVGGDRDAGAVTASTENAERAGVGGDTVFIRRALSETEVPEGSPGLLVSNPPYGGRIGSTGRLRDLYAALGNLARVRFPGWTLAVLSNDPALIRHVGLELEPRLATRHGGIGIRLWCGSISGDP